MPTIKTALDALAELSETRRKLEDARATVSTMANLPQAMRDENDALLAGQITRLDEQKAEMLVSLVRFPPHHMRHFDRLEAFFKKGTYEESVFIMTKYASSKAKKDREKNAELKRVIDTVRTAVTDAKCIPRLASDGGPHRLLWDHIELYLLGCGRGIAIVEDRYLPELNPNVAMEWGWMRAMGKSVLYLMEKSFKKARADLEGARREEFRWDAPEKDIPEAVATFLAETS